MDPFIVGIFLFIVLGVAWICYGYFAKPNEDRANYSREELESMALRGDIKTHNQKMEQIAQERLNIEKTDFVVSGYGKKRNINNGSGGLY